MPYSVLLEDSPQGLSGNCNKVQRNGWQCAANGAIYDGSVTNVTNFALYSLYLALHVFLGDLYFTDGMEMY